MTVGEYTSLDQRQQGERNALEEERLFLLRSLDDLEQERLAGDLDDEDYEALKSGYTARAAQVIRLLDGTNIEDSNSVLSAKDSTEQSRSAAPRWRRVATITAVAGSAIVLGLVVARSAGTRVPGQSVTGEIRSADGGTRLKVTRLLSEAQTFLNDQPVEAVKRYDEVLKLDPNNVEALSYRGWIVRNAARSANAADLLDEAERFLNRAVAADPGDPTARLFRGILLFRDRGNAAAAVADLQYALDHNPPPEMRPQIESVLADAQAANAEPTNPTTTAP